jgi:hypothetical protein
MKHFARIATVAVFALFAASAFAKDTRVVGLVFDKGAETATIPDEIKGDEPVMYRFRAKRGQSLAVALKPLNRNTDFILCGPGKWPGTVMHDSAASGSQRFEGKVASDGPHAVLVSRSAGRDPGEPARYDLAITLKKAAQ